MRKAFLAALLVTAIPALAMAQSQTATTPSSSNPVAPNLANPQAQGNQQQQPALAHSSPNNSDAQSIPTPVLNGQPSTPVHR